MSLCQNEKRIVAVANSRFFPSGSAGYRYIFGNYGSISLIVQNSLEGLLSSIRSTNADSVEKRFSSLIYQVFNIEITFKENCFENARPIDRYINNFTRVQRYVSILSCL